MRLRTFCIAVAVLSMFGPSASAASAHVLTGFDPIGAGHYSVSLHSYNGSAEIGVDKRLPRLHGDSFVTYDGSDDAGSKRHLESRFGKYGSVDLKLHQDGPFKTRKLDPGCHGTPDEVARATWRGTAKFTSEQSLVRIDRHSWPGYVTKAGDYTCAVGESGSRFALAGDRDSAFGTLSLQASSRAKKGSAPAIFARVNELKKGTPIDRGVSIRGLPGAFRFSRDLSSASLKTTGPFQGKATYVAKTNDAGESTGKIAGNLRVTFLGEGTSVPFTNIKRSYFRHYQRGARFR